MARSSVQDIAALVKERRVKTVMRSGKCIVAVWGGLVRVRRGWFDLRVC